MPRALGILLPLAVVLQLALGAPHPWVLGTALLWLAAATAQWLLDDRARAASASGTGEDLLRSRLCESPVPTLITSIDDGVVRDLNEACARFAGVDRERLVGRTIEELDVWEREADRAAYLRRLAEEGRVVNFRAPMRRWGEKIDALISGERHEIGGRAYAVTSIADMAALLGAREALRQSETRFAELFRRSPIAMALTRLDDGTILEMNEAMRRALGYTEPAPAGSMTPASVWADPAQREALVARLRHEERVVGYDARLLRNGGEAFDARLWGAVIEIGGETCVLAAIIDVSNEKLARALLEQRLAERTAALRATHEEIDTLSYSVSHDLRAPLRAVSGYSAVVLEEAGGKLDESHRSMLERSVAAARHMGRLIDDLLGLSRVSRGPLERRPVDLSVLARAVCEEQSRLHPDRPMRYEIEPGLQALGDRGLLKVVLENLISNAWKFTAGREGSQVTVGTERVGNETAFFVSDNGPGFDARFASKLFKPFQRLHTESEFPGTGIGLATVSRVIQRHGGRVWVDSAPGKGATFRFTLGKAPASA